MKAIVIGIMPQDKIRERVLSIARGEQHPSGNRGAHGQESVRVRKLQPAEHESGQGNIDGDVTGAHRQGCPSVAPCVMRTNHAIGAEPRLQPNGRKTS